MTDRRRRYSRTRSTEKSWIALALYAVVLGLMLFFGQRLGDGASGCFGEVAGPVDQELPEDAEDAEDAEDDQNRGSSGSTPGSTPGK